MRTLSGSGSSAARLSRKTASPRRIRRGPLAAVGSLGVLALLLTGCTSTPTAPAEPAQSSATPSATADDVSGTSLTVLVTDRLAETGEFLADFAATSGIDITVVNAGTPQQLASGVLDGSLVGDVIYGVDATFATRFAAAGALQDYVSPALDEKAAALQLTDAQAGAELTPVDVDYVCVNVDHTWFNANEVVEPKTLDDLIKPEYQGLLVVPSAAESSAGLFFLAASVAAFGETGWSVYWQDLLANGTEVGGTWAETYYDDYSGPSSTGTKPIVISYASSPASEMVTGTDGNVTTTTGVLLDTCIQQVGFAGVAAETTNQEGATQLIDYMLSPEFQATLPELASRYPATEIEIDADWSRMAPTPQNPFTLTARQLSDNRDRWVSQWQELVTEADAGAEEEASPSPSPTSSSKAKSKS